MNDLLENLKHFLEAGDVTRVYQLNRGEVMLIVDEIERLRGAQVTVMTFDDIRKEVRLKRRAENIAKGIDAEIREFKPKDIA